MFWLDNGDSLYYIYTIRDTINVPPSYFGEDIKKAAEELLRTKYERTLDKDLGVILSVFDVREISNGTILPGDPSVYHTVTCSILSFNLEVEEVVIGEVSELADFGCFVRLGPIDGLVHLSQITNDYINYDRKTSAFVLRASGRSLKKGDVVYAKVSTVSLKSNIKDTKIALTMRPEGLGKMEWIKEPIKPKTRERQPHGKKRK